MHHISAIENQVLARSCTAKLSNIDVACWCCLQTRAKALTQFAIVSHATAVMCQSWMRFEGGKDGKEEGRGGGLGGGGGGGGGRRDGRGMQTIMGGRRRGGRGRKGGRGRGMEGLGRGRLYQEHAQGGGGGGKGPGERGQRQGGRGGCKC